MLDDCVVISHTYLHIQKNLHWYGENDFIIAKGEKFVMDTKKNIVGHIITRT